MTRDLAPIAAARQDRRRRCRSTTSSRACATPPTGPAARSTRYQVASLPPPARPLAYAAEGTPDPYAGFEARIVPENITLLPKTASQVTGGNAWNERIGHGQEGRQHRHDPARTRRDARRDPRDRRCARPARPRQWPEGRPAAAHPGRRDRQPRAMQPVRVIVLGDSAIEAVVALSDLGRYVSVDVASMNTLGRRRRRRGGGRRQGHAALPEHLRDRAAQPDSAPGDREPDPHLFLRRRFPAQGAAGRFLRRALCRRRRDAATPTPRTT